VHLLIIALLFMLLGSYLSRRGATPLAKIATIDLQPEVTSVEPITTNADSEILEISNSTVETE
jgi:formate hydrogenlyase subunit 3/multisubunit Na+/H+ antiporter MnhD subunit